MSSTANTTLRTDWRYAGIEYDDVANGIGLGAVFFTQGCPHQCPHCHNPETWSNDGGNEFNSNVLKNLLQYYTDIPFATRLTMSGGDPIANPELTHYIITQFKEKYPDKTVWLYTGYDFEDILISHYKIIELCDVIVDGKFEIANRDITLQFKGSSNQRIINVQKSLRSNKIVLWNEGDIT